MLLDFLDIHYTMLAVGLGAFYTLLNFIFFWMFQISQQCHEEYLFNDSIKSTSDLYATEYKYWLLFCALVTIPLFIQLLLDVISTRGVQSEDQRNILLSRFMLSMYLLLPNAILYIVLTTYTGWDESFVAQLHYALFDSQSVGIFVGLTCSLTGHKQINHIKPSDTLSLQFTAYSLTAYLIMIMGKAVVFLLNKFMVISQFWVRILGLAIYSVGAILLIWMALNIIYFIGKQQVFGVRFLSHFHLNDFSHMITLLLFVFADWSIYRFSGKSGDCNNDYASYVLSLWYLKVKLFIQIALSFFLAIIPGQCHLLLAIQKEEKLQIRLNLIRYVSHELRTPLNTGFVMLSY